MIILWILAWLWSLPTEIVGALLLFGYGPSRPEWRAGRLILCVERLIGYDNTVGQTWGRLIFVRRDWADAVPPATVERIIRHETNHSEWCDRLGPLWMFAYGGACFVAVLSGGNYYVDNFFERAARRAEVDPPLV